MIVVLFTVKTSRKNCQGPILILSDVFVFGTGTPSLTLLPASLRAPPPHTHTINLGGLWPPDVAHVLSGLC